MSIEYAIAPIRIFPDSMPGRAYCTIREYADWRSDHPLGPILPELSKTNIMSAWRSSQETGGTAVGLALGVGSAEGVGVTAGLALGEGKALGSGLGLAWATAPTRPLEAAYCFSAASRLSETPEPC